MDHTKKIGRDPSWAPEHSHYYSDQQRAVLISVGMRVRKGKVTHFMRQRSLAVHSAFTPFLFLITLAVSEGYKTGPKPQQPQVIATTTAAAVVNASVSLDTKQQRDATPATTVITATVGAGQHQTLLTDWYEPVSRKRAREEEEKDIVV